MLRPYLTQSTDLRTNFILKPQRFWLGQKDLNFMVIRNPSAEQNLLSNSTQRLKAASIGAAQ
jgi:hypothetical protein